MELNRLRVKVEGYQNLEKSIGELYELSKLNEQEQDKKIEKEIENKLRSLRKKFQAYRTSALFTGSYCERDCLLSIHAGAGGTDAQDWASMLLRMYLRYAEKLGYKTEVLEESHGSEAGIKSVVLKIEGKFAFGHFQPEAGVHRLIRQSPFNPTHTRETSFALVEVLPELETNEETRLDPSELKIETSTARGHGGQSVNTTYSAVRITHIPTGIKVSIQNERSQYQNKQQALKILQSKLKMLQNQKEREEKMKIRGEFHSAEWGNQIRSYTLHPYKLVKDHRTNFESSNPEKVLGGNLDDFLASYLEKNAQEKNQQPSL